MLTVPVRVVRAERNISISGATLPGRDGEMAIVRSPARRRARRRTAFFDLHRYATRRDGKLEFKRIGQNVHRLPSSLRPPPPLHPEHPRGNRGAPPPGPGGVRVSPVRRSTPPPRSSPPTARPLAPGSAPGARQQNLHALADALDAHVAEVLVRRGLLLAAERLNAASSTPSRGRLRTVPEPVAS